MVRGPSKAPDATRDVKTIWIAGHFFSKYSEFRTQVSNCRTLSYNLSNALGNRAHHVGPSCLNFIYFEIFALCKAHGCQLFKIQLSVNQYFIKIFQFIDRLRTPVDDFEDTIYLGSINQFSAFSKLGFLFTYSILSYTAFRSYKTHATCLLMHTLPYH